MDNQESSCSHKELTLKNLLDDPKVDDCVFWVEVGLELGIKQSKLDKIEIDCHHPHIKIHRIDVCKRKMFHYWLENYDASWEEVYRAVERVKSRHKRSEMRESILSDETKAEIAIHEIRRVLDELEARNKKLAAHHKKFVDQLCQVKQEWLSNDTKWTEVNEQWQQGEPVTNRDKIRKALETGDIRSIYVKDYLQSEGIQPDNLSDEEVQYHLHQALLKIEGDRSKQVRPRYEQMKKLDKQMEHLLSEIDQTKELIEKRVEVYEKIMKGLERLGVKPEKLKELNDQVETLAVTLEKCTKAREECKESISDQKQALGECETNLKTFLASFKNSVTGMQNLELKLTDMCNSQDREIQQLKITKAHPDTALGGAALGAVGGGASGMVAGAVAGSVALPVIGTAIGALIGGLTGAALFSQQNRRAEENEQKRRNQLSILEERKRQLTILIHNCQLPRYAAENELDKLKGLIDKD